MQIALASGPPGFFFGGGKTWKQVGREDCDNRDDDEQFNEGKRGFALAFRRQISRRSPHASFFR